MKRPAFLFAYLTAISIFECTILVKFRLFSVQPDMLLAAVIIFALVLPLKWVIILGCFSGFLLDLFSSNPLGFNTIIFCMLGFICKKIIKKLNIENNIVVLILVFILSFAAGVVRRSFEPGVSLWVFLKVGIIESLYTALIFPFMRRLFLAIA